MDGTRCPAIRLTRRHDGPRPEAIRDTDATLVRWLRRKKAAAVVLRPDGFIYAAAESGQPLPSPPVGYSRDIVSTPTKAGVTA